MESSSLASTIEKDLQKEGYKKVDVDKADAEVTTVQENVPTLRSRQVSRYALVIFFVVHILPLKLQPCGHDKCTYYPFNPRHPIVHLLVTDIIHFLTPSTITLNINTISPSLY